MKAFALKFDCNGYDFYDSVLLKVFLIKERALEAKNCLENLFDYYSSALEDKLAERDKSLSEFKQTKSFEKTSKEDREKATKEINDNYAKDASALFKDFLERCGDLKDFFKKEHLALREEYSFCLDEVEFEGE